ncbi:two-component sensor histidine kinase [Streptomyces sp. CS113]|uniref:sensor histidine kinase n=1 Tax=Streptomyces sp. CS113 TaxID=1982761 RepID=UPI000B40C27A|nr:histidine kinase [Streptomyces sp. CS113]OWA02850.1 two-component sensor histidine kinase [Streptomyces sp. CS113]
MNGLFGRVRAAYDLLVARRSALFDLVLAVIATGVELGLLFDDGTPVAVTPVVVTVLTGSTLLLRRRAPLSVLAAACAGAAALVPLGYSPGGAPVVVALASLADLRDRRVSVAALVPTALFLLLASISSPPVPIGAWALGSYLQTRRRYTRALEDRAATLERERAQLDQLAAQRERTAIARELHDIVAHSVTVMLIGVRGARDVLPTDPRVAGETLERVEVNAEQSLAELRRILGLLRASEHGAQWRPQPSLGQLAELVSGYRTAGMPVRLEFTGEARPLADGLELSAYRIVEEALTNVLKHTDPTRVAVTLHYGRSRLDVTVEDDGHGGRDPVPSAAGHGILGMRERAAVTGGSLDARRTADGFVVTARLPVEDAGGAA